MTLHSWEVCFFQHIESGWVSNERGWRLGLSLSHLASTLPGLKGSCQIDCDILMLLPHSALSVIQRTLNWIGKIFQYFPTNPSLPKRWWVTASVSHSQNNRPANTRIHGYLEDAMEPSKSHSFASNKKVWGGGWRDGPEITCTCYSLEDPRHLTTAVPKDPKPLTSQVPTHICTYPHVDTHT